MHPVDTIRVEVTKGDTARIIIDNYIMGWVIYDVVLDHARMEMTELVADSGAKVACVRCSRGSRSNPWRKRDGMRVGNTRAVHGARQLIIEL